MITPVMISSIGWRTYILFTILLALFVPIVYFGYPESEYISDPSQSGAKSLIRLMNYLADFWTASNLSLEEIDNLFLTVEHQVRAGSISFHPATEKGRRASYSSITKNPDVVENV